MARTKRVPPEPKALDPLPEGTNAVIRSGLEAVVYHIPTAPSTDNSPLKTVISLPRHSDWTSGLHFHASHTEFLCLVKGAIFVELNGKTKLISALAGGQVDSLTGKPTLEGLVIEVPRYARHSWGRIEHWNQSNRSFGRGAQHMAVMPEDWAEEAVVEEWTNPSDIDKPLFFWNLNGIMNAPVDTVLPKRQAIAKAFLGKLWIDLQLFVVFWELDNWPIFALPQTISPGFDSNLRTLRVVDSAEIAYSFVVLMLARLVGLSLGLMAVKQERTPRALWEAHKNATRGL